MPRGEDILVGVVTTSDHAGYRDVHFQAGADDEIVSIQETVVCEMGNEHFELLPATSSRNHTRRRPPHAPRPTSDTRGRAYLLPATSRVARNTGQGGIKYSR